MWLHEIIYFSEALCMRFNHEFNNVKSKYVENNFQQRRHLYLLPKNNVNITYISFQMKCRL